jgi:hypothetical protein
LRSDYEFVETPPFPHAEFSTAAAEYSQLKFSALGAGARAGGRHRAGQGGLAAAGFVQR